MPNMINIATWSLSRTENELIWQGAQEISCFLFLTEEAYSHGRLQTRKLGQTPLRKCQPAPIWTLNRPIFSHSTRKTITKMWKKPATAFDRASSLNSFCFSQGHHMGVRPSFCKIERGGGSAAMAPCNFDPSYISIQDLTTKNSLY